jgi:hypothetical protein
MLSDSGTADLFTIRPRLKAVFVMFARLLLIVIGVPLIGFALLQLALHGPSAGMTATGWVLGAFALVGVSIVFGLLLALLTIPWNVTLTRDQLVGRSYMGFRRRLRYADVGELRIDQSQGFPLLWVNDRTSKNSFVMYFTGLDLDAVHAALSRRAGADHPLTQFFAP